LSGVGFALLGLKYWPILTLVAAMLSIVPIFGALISSVPAVLVALTQDPWLAVWTLLWIICIHQLEAHVLNPKIIGTVTKLHPVVVVFALLLGERTMGVWGAVLALPTLSLCHGLFNHFRAEYLTDGSGTSQAG
jgi:predicted PurR-regulated permease PerM